MFATKCCTLVAWLQILIDPNDFQFTWHHFFEWVLFHCKLKYNPFVWKLQSWLCQVQTNPTSMDFQVYNVLYVSLSFAQYVTINLHYKSEIKMPLESSI